MRLRRGHVQFLRETPGQPGRHTKTGGENERKETQAASKQLLIPADSVDLVF